MVWADGNPVLNKNEAYAFAHCQNCQATAISFQVVLIVGQAHVVVPQNISAAVNYDCVSCLAQALAEQLVVTLPDNPSPAELQQLTALWQQIQYFSTHLQGLSFTEIRSRLTGYEQQILQIVQQDSSSSTGSAVPSQSAGTPTGTSATGTSSTDSVAPTGSDQLTSTVPASTVPPSAVDTTPPATPTNSGSTVPSTNPSPSGT
jgi:putative peptide zinc metalloprotease protein